MIRSVLLKVFLLFSPTVILAQEYFQQDLSYVIDVKLNDVKHELSGFETIEYTNNSNDTLRFLYFHLWPNAYKNQKTALAKQLMESGETKMYFADQDELGYIDSLNFQIDDLPVKWELDPKNIDICNITLGNPLFPGQKIKITTPFHVKIPSGEISRLGHLDQAYTITQWYPKPAVYDREGWHQMPYLNQGEFYSEFGTYEVNITLPKNYVLGATGDRIEEQEEDAWMNEKVIATDEKYKKLKTPGISKEEYARLTSMTFPESDKEFKTITFKQYKVHDFAWFCDKRYNVIQSEVQLPYNHQTVKTWALFTNKNLMTWEYSSAYLNDATFFYSLWNGDYQYLHVTAVDGTISAGGGMEYPNITVIGDAGNEFTLETVIMHEVGHNWFYGMLGSNERDHPWMDEGINSFNEMRYIRTKYPLASMADVVGRDSSFRMFGINKIRQAEQYNILYQLQAKTNHDQPCELRADKQTDFNYGAIVYSKTAVLFNYLMNYMGENDFDAAMQFYFDKWKFKHPQPKDLRNTLEYFSEKKLSWFFDDLIGSTKKLDYKICNTKRMEDGSWEIEVKNVGDIEGPVAICGVYNGKVRGIFWGDGFSGKKTLSFPPSDIDYFKIDYFEWSPEINRKNNTIRTKGLFRKTEKLEFTLLGGLDKPNKTQTYFSPAFGYNSYNGFMAGFAFYNHFLFQKKIEWDILPMYASQNNDLAGYAQLKLNFTPKKVFQQISIGVSGARFAYASQPYLLNFNKVTPFIQFNVKKRNPRSNVSHSFKVRNINLFTDGYDYVLNQVGTQYEVTRDSQQHNYIDASYILKNDKAINPYSLLLNFQGGDYMSKLALTLKYYLTINEDKSIEFRVFGGSFLDQTNAGPYRFRMSGQTGYQDYFYDHIYLGRSETQGLWPNQFTETDGAFKVYTPLGQSAEWIVALNIKSPKPFKIPLKLYADLGTASKSALLNDELLYNAGIDICIAQDVFEIYIPLVMNKDIRTTIDINNKTFLETIRFTLNLSMVNPLDIIKNAFSF